MTFAPSCLLRIGLLSLPFRMLRALRRELSALTVVQRSPVLAAQPWVALPPVDPHLLRGLQRRDHQAQLDGEQLAVEQVHPDVTRDDQTLVQDPLQDVAQARGPVA